MTRWLRLCVVMMVATATFTHYWCGMACADILAPARAAAEHAHCAGAATDSDGARIASGSRCQIERDVIAATLAAKHLLTSTVADLPFTACSLTPSRSRASVITAATRASTTASARTPLRI